jgi:hypothetical protein
VSGVVIPGEAAFIAGSTSFPVGLRPQDAVALPLRSVLDLLKRRYGTAIDVALSQDATNLDRPLAELPEPVRSPLASRPDSSWLGRTNMVGVNVRTVGDYGGVIKYAITLPASVDSLQLLPIWEPGVVESLYGIAGWNLNTEFFSEEMHAVASHLDTPARQLRAASNLLHVMGKAVGMDVIPHTDRFSEAALGTPDLFEWMRVVDREIVDKSAALTRRAEETVHEWLLDHGPAIDGDAYPEDVDGLFAMDEDDRLAVLFGGPGDIRGRTDRRIDLITTLKRKGLEPVPATMGVPFRGLVVDPDPDHTVVDDYGMEWPDFLITKPEYMSRVFSPLARFKLYERLDDNADWQIDFAHPRQHVWDYVCTHYSSARHIGNFDFMRGDMSHVQMRPDGVPDVVDDHYDILAAVKQHIQDTQDAPWFAYFAETFLPARDVFQYGEELDHLEASLADATLGDLQSTVVGSPEFLRRFRRYLDDLATRKVAPSFTIMTADKDDPRFDEFYRAGNEARLFTALLLPDMPSYMGLGFEIRDVHDEPVENERYTKLFVFREHGESNVHPSKARHGDRYIWGTNDALFDRITAIRLFAERTLPEIAGTTTTWLIPPDATGLRGTAVWTQSPVAGARFVFAVNYDLERPSGYFGIPMLGTGVELVEEFSTIGGMTDGGTIVTSNGFFHRVENLEAGEGRAYRIRS